MPEPDDLHLGLRALAERLDRASRPASAETAMGRTTPAPSRPRWPLVAAAAAVVAALLTAGMLASIGSDDGAGVTTDSGPTTTSPAPEEPPYTGTGWADLPDAGVAVSDGDRIRLLNFDGAELGVAAAPVAADMGTGPTRRTLVVRPGELLELVDADLAQSPDGCDEAAGGGGRRVALCGGEPQTRDRIVTVTPTGGATPLLHEAPGSEGAGHWRWAIPSPAGRWILGQWSGECEVPTAYFIAPDGQEVRTADHGDGSVTSLGVGWAPDGRAVVQFGPGFCSDAVETPGIYLVDPDSGARELVRSQEEDHLVVSLWERRAHGNDAELVAHRALAELGLEGCCGEPSHGGPGATTGARWQGTDIPVLATPADEPPFVPFNDLVLESRPDTIEGAPVTAGEADLGPFVAFTCGRRVWSVGGAGLATSRPGEDAVRSLAEALLPHLYCTVGPRPGATGHG